MLFLYWYSRSAPSSTDLGWKPHPFNFLRANHYVTLGIRHDAMPEEIDAAYEVAFAAISLRQFVSGRTYFARLRLTWQINALAKARTVLKEPTLRREYDAMLKRIEMLAQTPPGLL